ncbi:hypothetical protein ACO0K0_02425 [Undibacterium sp. SXout11W]|uniref:hypothetical protein n=1 Tax=Undibacterium sp. SXout11W TaxID=3413050 RepID=UPI003BEFBE46
MMAVPVTEQILAAIKAVLCTIPGMAQSVFRSREEALQREELPAFVVMPDEEDTERFGGNTDRNTFRFELRIFVRGSVWDSVAAPLDQLADRAIMLSPELVALTDSLRRTGSRYNGANADETAGEQVIRYQATYLSNIYDRSSRV